MPVQLTESEHCRLEEDKRKLNTYQNEILALQEQISAKYKEIDQLSLRKTELRNKITTIATTMMPTEVIKPKTITDKKTQQATDLIKAIESQAKNIKDPTIMSKLRDILGD